MSIEGNRFEPAAAHSLLALVVTEDWSRIQSLLGVLQKDMKAALRTAVRQTGQWANREGARGIAKAANVPLNVLRKGLRIKFQYQSFKGAYSEARLWYGLNDVSLKFLGARQQKKGVRARGNTYKSGFISSQLGGHAFQRVGNARLPIKRIELPIAEKGNAFLADFEKRVADKFVESFFGALDKATGRESGTSAGIAGNINISRA
jgi:hypothetical protein